MLQTAKKLLLDILFPPVCLNCSQHLKKDAGAWVICRQCFQNTTVHNSLFCPACLNRLTSLNNAHCHPQTQYLLASATDYSQTSIQKLLWQLKYQGWLSAAQPLAEFMSLYLHNLSRVYRLNLRENFLAVPIPLHHNRELKRGFNQSLILTNLIAHNFNLPVIKDNLTRIKNTTSQTELKNYQQREENVKNSFVVTHPEQLQNKNILLIDDVSTSGATINEAVRVLKLAGAKKVIALVAAKAR